MRVGLALYLAGVVVCLLGSWPDPPALKPDPHACTATAGLGAITLDRETAEHLALAWNDPTLSLAQVATRFGCREANILGRRHAIEQHGFRLRAR